MINDFIIKRIENAYRSELEYKEKEIIKLNNRIKELESKSLLNYIVNNKATI